MSAQVIDIRTRMTRDVDDAKASLAVILWREFGMRDGSLYHRAMARIANLVSIGAMNPFRRVVAWVRSELLKQPAQVS